MTTQNLFNLNAVDPSWHACIQDALKTMDPIYLKKISQDTNWLPGREKIFNAFSLPVDKVNYILFGESPYPRAHSANGYAFWDAAVTGLWSPEGMSKQVNRATSLRNIIKMLLVAEGVLNPNQTSQSDIAKLDKRALVTTNAELFTNFLAHGFLLLNATPILQVKHVRKDALLWLPFIKHILHFIINKHPHIQLILFGKVANLIHKVIPDHSRNQLQAEHPYNISFIHNQNVIHFFKPLHLLKKN